MSRRYALRELARADLEAIWVYTVEQWGVEQAGRDLQGFLIVSKNWRRIPGSVGNGMT